MIDARLGPEPAQQWDLLLHAGRAVREIDPERLVLDVVPPDAHAEPDAAGREQRERGDLLRDQRSLALRQHEDVGHELEVARAGEVGEQDERLEERVPVVVGSRSNPGGADVGAEDVVVDEEVVVPGVLEALDEGDDLVGIDRRNSACGNTAPSRMLLRPYDRLASKEVSV